MQLLRDAAAVAPDAMSAEAAPAAPEEVAPPVAAEGGAAGPEAGAEGSDTFYLEQVTLDESDDEYNYDGVAEDPEVVLKRGGLG